SEIWRCMVEGRKLPPRAFFDGSGGYTRDPARARAAEIFGGYKGYALSLAIQVMSGSLVTAEMGGMIRVPRHIGYYFQAIDPSVFQDIDAFKAANTRLAREIKLSRRKSGVMEVYLPGERGERRRKHALKTGFVELGDGTARMLDRVVGWDDARTYS
ncbi:MAG: Ldh family oxidoreductase, partial [Candidatus Micrarchaeota archaeon]|nr:Ldh family oxidoreductase [Candidatus Micrarchaeota archaeon]